MSERMFPIMRWSLGTGIPWRIIAPHEKQAHRNHRQSLERLASRGGLDPSEAIAVLRGRAWGPADRVLCDERLQHIIELRMADTLTPPQGGKP